MKTNLRLMTAWTCGLLAVGGGFAAAGLAQSTATANRPKIVQPPARPQGQVAPAKPGSINANVQDFPKLPYTFNWDGEGKMNDYFVQQFIDSANFGNLRMIPRTMMIDDAMRLIRHDSNDLDSRGEPAQYKLDNLELIGVAKHDVPVAFIVNRHERSGANFATVTTRPLTAFESKSLDQLRAGTEAVVETDATGCRVVGPVRAQELCVECHAGAKVGDVLGAFSYKLTRLEIGDAKAPPPVKAAARPVASRGIVPTAPWSGQTSEPVAVDGLEVVIQPSRDIIPTNEPLAVRVTFHNTSGQTLRLPNNTFLYGDWLLKLEDTLSGKRYTAGFGANGNQTTDAVPSAPIPPGDSLQATAAYFAGASVVEGDLDFDAFQKVARSASMLRAPGSPAAPLSPFQPSEYKVRLEVRFPNAVTTEDGSAPVWKHNDIVSNAVTVKIGPLPPERTGVLSGIVLDRHGRPAVDATLVCAIALPYNLSPPAANSPYAKGIANRPTMPAGRMAYAGGFGPPRPPVARTDAQGGFVISGLPPGTYVVEAQLPAADLLHWPQNAPSQIIEVKPGTETKMNNPLQLDYNRSL